MAVIRMVHPKHGMLVAAGAEIEQNKLNGWVIEVPKKEVVNLIEVEVAPVVVSTQTQDVHLVAPKKKAGRHAKGR